MATGKTSLKQCIEDISSKNTDYRHPEQAINQAESLKSLSSDLYTDNIRFIYELIQNADDAQAKNIILTIMEEKYLIIAHDGNTFDEKDLQGLCGVNNGTKKKDLDKTGYKGLGFKAVFGKSDNVIIYSNGEYFRFDSSHQIEWSKRWRNYNQRTWEKENDRQFIYPWQINPVWTKKKEIPCSILDFLNQRREEIHVANIILLNNVEEIHLAINQLKQQPQMFLFLRNISQMRFSNLTPDILSIDRNSNYGSKKIYFNGEIVSQWIIKRFELVVSKEVRDKLAEDSKAPEKLRVTKKAEIFFAAKSDDDGSIEKLQDKESHLFSYLPTKIFEYIFPVLINANFLTNVNREQIHTDSAWNQWLFEKIGSEIFQWIKELVENEEFSFQAYRLIPLKLNLTNNILSQRFNDSLETSVKRCNFILNRKKQFLRVDEAIMDSTSMSKETNFIHSVSMRRYIIDHYKDSSFQCASDPFIDYDSNLHRVGVREFTWHNCIQMFKSDIFLKTHSIEQNKRMIKYFYKTYSHIGTADDMDISIGQIPFLMDQNNRLQLIKDIYFPDEIIDDSGTINSSDLFVNNLIFKWLNEYPQKDIKQWLQNLGVSGRTDLTYLHKTILSNTTSYATHENTIRTIKMLFMLFQQNNISRKDSDQLKELKLLTTRGTLIPAERCFFSDQYNPSLRLEEHLKTKEDCFLSFIYVTNDISQGKKEDLLEWRRFFLRLGVQDELHTIEFSQKLTNSAAIGYKFRQKYLSTISDGYSKVEAYFGLTTITFLEHTESNYDFAKLFWSYVIQNIKAEKFRENTKIYWGHSNKAGAIDGTPISNSNYVKWFVKNTQCIPTTLNTSEFSSHILFDSKEMKNLCGEYMPFPSISLSEEKSDWYRIFDFKIKLSLNDYFRLLEKIRYDQNNLKTNLDRIQIIYSYILKDIQSYSACEYHVIKSQKDIIYLLSEDNQWKLSHQLYFYLDGNDTNGHLNDLIPCLKLDLMNRKNLNLSMFLDLFNIKQIGMNDLLLVDENSSPAEQFRNKLLEISPFIKKWLKKFSFQSDVISMIDQILQQETQFIESDCLKLFYNENFVQETNFYFDTIHQQFYVTRPWDSETTLMDLPKKLSQLLNIQGFEDKFRFLLKAEKEEIIKHFKKLSIEIPTDNDIVILKPISKSEIVEEVNSSPPLTLDSKESDSIKDKQTTIEKSRNHSQALEKPTHNSDNQNNTISPLVNVKISYGSTSLHQIDHGWLSTKDSNDKILEIIDLSDIIISTSESLNRIEGNRSLDQRIVGDIGEQMVYKYLQKQYSNKKTSIFIKWENENGETHLPYDILLIKNKKKYYIEVKSTRTNHENSFSISNNQMEAIFEHREYYSIYRVYTEKKELIIFKNIRQCLQNQNLNCILTINSQLSNKTL